MFPVGLCEWKITNVHPILAIMLKNVLETFGAKILKIFLNKKTEMSILSQKFGRSDIQLKSVYAVSQNAFLFTR